MEQLIWFEEVCKQLNKDPAEATRIINEFQGNKESYELSRYFFGLITLKYSFVLLFFFNFFSSFVLFFCSSISIVLLFLLVVRWK